MRYPPKKIIIWIVSSKMAKSQRCNVSSFLEILGVDLITWFIKSCLSSPNTLTKLAYRSCASNNILTISFRMSS